MSDCNVSILDLNSYWKGNMNFTYATPLQYNLSPELLGLYQNIYLNVFIAILVH